MSKKLVMILMGVLLFVAVNSTPAFSQDDIGGYGALTVMGTSFFNFSQWDVLLGMRGGITINRTITIGLSTAGSMGIMTQSAFSSGTDDNTDKIGWMYYGGTFLEYTAMAEEKFHFSVPVELVLGSVHVGSFQLLDIFGDDDSYKFLVPNLFWGVIPGINFDINVAEFFVIGLHAGYRFAFLGDTFVGGEKVEYISNHYDIWGLETGLILRFGKF